MKGKKPMSNVSTGNVVVDKSFEFAVEIVKTVKKLKAESKEYEMASQLLRSGTSVGANIAEAQRAQTGKEFVAKMSIASKEANETIYWLRLLNAAEIMSKEETKPLLTKAIELDRILVSIIKTKQEKISSAG